MGFTRPTTPVPWSIWQDLGQDGSERFCSLGAVAFPPVDTRNEADRLCAGRLCRLDQTGDGCAPILIPVVEGIDLAQSDERRPRSRAISPARTGSIPSKTGRPRSFLGSTPTQPSSAARSRKAAKPSFGAVFWFRQSPWRPPWLGCVAQASRFMIHSTSGAGTKRHFRSGPAMTFR